MIIRADLVKHHDDVFAATCLRLVLDNKGFIKTAKPPFAFVTIVERNQRCRHNRRNPRIDRTCLYSQRHRTREKNL
jgi:hypothetical protein